MSAAVQRGVAAVFADPRLYFVSAYTLKEGLQDHILFRLTVDADGQAVSLEQIETVVPAYWLGGFAASPDGTRIAFRGLAGGPGPNALPSAEINVVTVATGEQRTFSAGRPGHVSSLSWAADGRHLAFQLDGVDGEDGIRILDTHRDDGDLLAGSRRVVGWQTTFVGEFTTPVISPDGTRIHVIAAQQTDDGRRVTRVVEFDARTGEQLRVLFEQPYVDRGNVPWAFTQMTRDPSGRLLLVVDGAGSAYRIDIATAQATRLPSFNDEEPNSIAW